MLAISPDDQQGHNINCIQRSVNITDDWTSEARKVIKRRSLR